MTSPDVTILIPMFNAEPFIEESLSSALAQTHRDICVLIIDDGSTDRSREVAARAADNRTRIIMHPMNRGRTAAVATGLKAVEIEFTAILGADDILLPDLIERELDMFRGDSRLDVVSCALESMSATGQRSHHVERVPVSHEEIAVTMLHHPAVSHGGAMGRTSVMTSVPYDAPFDVAEDYYFWVRLFLNGARFANIPTAHYLYRQHPGQPVVVEKQAMMEAHCAVQRILVDSLFSQASKAEREALLSWLAPASAWRPESWPDGTSMDTALRATRFLVEHPHPLLPSSAVQELRRKVVERDVIARGGTPSARELMKVWSELPWRQRVNVTRRVLRRG